MKEQIINFETAKLAKEKGFTGFYDTTEYIQMYDNGYSEDSFTKLVEKQGQDEIDVDYFLLAPTQSLLQKWLRDIHNIYVSVASNSLDIHFPMNQILEDGGSQMAGPKFLKIYKTYEEALEVGLYEALKLIK